LRSQSAAIAKPTPMAGHPGQAQRIMPLVNAITNDAATHTRLTLNRTFSVISPPS
jgi:hypothetical protein